MAKFYGRNASQKEFLKLFDSLTGAHSRWEVWKDMIWLFATAISNAVDKRYYDQRERAYMDIIKRYDERQQNTFPELLTMLVMAMDNRGFDDFLGDLYMNLELGNDRGGQFFTPYHICKCMAEMCLTADMVQNRIEQTGYTSIYDPACGAGATLIAAADVIHQRGVNYQQTALFVGQDIDSTVALMCYIQLSLLGCPGYIKIGNTLTEPMTGHVLFGDNDANTWYTPMYFTGTWEWRRKFVLIDGMTRDAIKEQLPAKQSEYPVIIEQKPSQGRNRQAQGQLMFDIG